MSDFLKPWYAVATPHEDIRNDILEEAIFAANIWAVVQETAPMVYRDPEEFFKKTHMTLGLGDMLKRVAAALNGDADSGDRMISLQTAFGGGKTHTLVALWHLAKHGVKLKKSSSAGKLRQVLGDRFPEKVRGVAVFSNATCDVTQGRKTPDGIHTHTLWGELALQLGGPALYEKIRPNDETLRAPQGLFVDILRAATPCLILIDELADYCVPAAAVTVGNTTLADQTISFVQQLNDAVQQVPGTMLVATLPASKYEVAHSEQGQEAFTTLEKRFQRQGKDIKPVADDEIYEVVRARLFESITPQGQENYPKNLAEVYQKMYAAHEKEVPAEASKNTYRQQIERAFPFHPLLIDAFYTRWGSHPDFQRTRGVLRLLASIVANLWKRRDSNTQTQHLIQPSHLRWTVDALQAALTRLWGPAYQSVIAADVCGEKSNAVILDDERGNDYRKEKIAEGLASAILLGSFGGKGERTGFSSRDLKLAFSRHGLNWNYTDGALLELENRSFYLHAVSAGNFGKRYWFGTKPTLNQLVVRYRQQNSDRNFDDEILEALKTQTSVCLSGPTWHTLTNPGTDLAEQKSLALIFLPPSMSWGEDAMSQALVAKYVQELSARCGAKTREYRNTLLFLAPHAKTLNKLRQAHREKAALEGVKKDYGDQMTEQRGELDERLKSADKAATEALGPTYCVALRIHSQEVGTSVLADSRNNFQEHLSNIWYSLVEDEEWILRRLGSVTLQNAGLVLKDGGISLKEAVEAFLRYTDKPMIANKQAVTTGLTQACKDGLIGIARGVSLSNIQARYCRQEIALDPVEEGVWIIPPFIPEEVAVGVAKTASSQLTATSPNSMTASPSSIAMPAGAKPSQLVKRITIKGAVPVENYGDLFRSFVGPATKMNLKKLHLGVEFEFQFPDDQAVDANDPRIKSMKEAARQLGVILETETRDNSRMG